MRPLILTGHIKPISSIKFSKEGDLLFASGKDKIATVWYTKDGKLLGSFSNKGAVNCLDVNDETTRLVTAVATGDVNIWDIQTGKLIVSMYFGRPVKGVQFAEGGQKLVIGTEKALKYSAAIHIVDIPKEVLQKNTPYTEKITPTLSFDVENTRLNCCLWGPLNETIFVGCEDGTIRVFDKEGKLLQTIEQHKNSVNRISMSQDKMLFISASSDNTAKLFDTTTLKLLKTYRSSEPVNTAFISPLKDHIVLGGGTSSSLVTTTVARNAYFEARFFHMVYEEEIGTVKGHFGPIHALAFSPDGKSYVSGGEDGFVR
eukprot:gene8396-221_t